MLRILNIFCGLTKFQFNNLILKRIKRSLSLDCFTGNWNNSKWFSCDHGRTNNFSDYW